MKKIISTLILTFCLLQTSWAQNSELKFIEIKVKSRSIVNSENVRVGDLGILNGFDVEVIKKISNVIVTMAPSPGKTIRINENLIRTKLRAFENFDIRIDIPRNAVVERLAQRVDGDDLARLIFEDFASLTGLSSETFEPNGKINDIMLPEGQVDYRLENMNGRNVEGNLTYKVDFFTDGNLAHTEYVRFKKAGAKFPDKIKTIQTAKLTKAPKTAAVIASKSIKPELNPIQRVSSQNVNLLSNSSSSSINSRNEMAIRGGSIVRIIYSNRGFKLETIGVAKNSGEVGQIIEVINQSTKRSVLGRVINESEVTVL